MSEAENSAAKRQSVPPRYCPAEVLPTAPYVPGRSPRSDRPHQTEGEPPLPLAPDNWRECRLYLWGIDLFNHGCYWEAHEAWESLWHAAGRSGTTASYLKGLIKLAAAGVKVLEGRPKGAAKHAARAAELFAETAAGRSDSAAPIAGLELVNLIRSAQQIAHEPPIVLALWILPAG